MKAIPAPVRCTIITLLPFQLQLQITFQSLFNKKLGTNASAQFVAVNAG